MHLSLYERRKPKHVSFLLRLCILRSRWLDKLRNVFVNCTVTWSTASVHPRWKSAKTNFLQRQLKVSQTPRFTAALWSQKLNNQKWLVFVNQMSILLLMLRNEQHTALNNKSGLSGFGLIITQKGMLRIFVLSKCDSAKQQLLPVEKLCYIYELRTYHKIYKRLNLQRCAFCVSIAQALNPLAKNLPGQKPLYCLLNISEPHPHWPRSTPNSPGQWHQILGNNLRPLRSPQSGPSSTPLRFFLSLCRSSARKSVSPDLGSVM